MPARIAAAAVLSLLALAVDASAMAFNSDLVGTFNGEARGIWGYSNAGHEYALVCGKVGLWVVDVSHPPATKQIALVPSLGSGFLEVRTYWHYAYAVNQTGPVQIIDLADPAQIRTVATFQSVNIPGAHTIEIDGHYAYLCLWGVGPRDLRILDLANPLAPVEVGHWRHPDMPSLAPQEAFAPPVSDAMAVGPLYTCGEGAPPPSGGGDRRIAPASVPVNQHLCEGEPGLQSHDCYVRGNRGYVANVLGGFAIIDLTDKTNPKTLKLVPYAGALSHSMWLNEDGKYLFTCDERMGGHLRVWTVENPLRVREVASFETQPGHMIHNVYVRGDLAYVSYYTDGLRVLDVSVPTRPVEVAYYDTYGGIDGAYFAGAWGAYPYAPSNNVLVSDLNKGLFVVRVDPTLRAGWFEGFVRDAVTNQPLGGAQVRFLQSVRSVEPDDGGYFGLWLGEGPQTMVVDHYGHWPDTTTIQVRAGLMTATYPALTPLPWGTLRIQVTGPGGSLGLEGAAVNIPGLPGTRRIAGPDGIVDWGPVPVRDYVADVGCFGYVAKRTPIQPVPDPPPDDSTGAIPTFRIPLVRGFFDNCDTDQGWLLEDPSDDATSGRWVRADPNASWRLPTIPTQPDWDADVTQFGFAFHTGYNVPEQPQEWNQVDGGHTTLTSPPFDITAYADPVIYYSRWFSNDTGDFPGEDPFRAELSNDGGTTWTTLEQITLSARLWELKQFRVRDTLPPTNRMRIRFIAQDYGGESVVEAAVDRIGVQGSVIVGAPEGTGGGRTWLASPIPNPAPDGRSSVTFQLARAVVSCRLELIDARGRLVQVLADGPRAAGPHAVRVEPPSGAPAWAAGLYWLRLAADGERATTKFVVIRP